MAYIEDDEFYKLCEIYNNPAKCDLCGNIYEDDQLIRCDKCKKYCCSSCMYEKNNLFLCSKCIEGE